MIAIDTTVLMPLHTRGPLFNTVRRVSARDPVWVVPLFWRLDLCNALIEYARATADSADDAYTFLLAAEMLIRESHETVPEDAIITLAVEAGISATQAAYVLTARRLGAPLVTADPTILAGCPDTAVSVETFGAI